MSKSLSINEIIKEFLFHSLSESQLNDLTNYFNEKPNNIRLIGDSNDILFSEIKLMGGCASVDPNNHLNQIQSSNTFLVFLDYQGNNETKIIEY